MNSQNTTHFSQSLVLLMQDMELSAFIDDGTFQRRNKVNEIYEE